MLAAVFRGAEEPLRVERVDDPAPEGNEILIRVEACGACHSDLHVMKDHFVPLDEGQVLGHEVSGRVAAFGPDCQNPHGLTEGDPVLVSWIASCGMCPECSRGEENLCRFLEMPGITPGRQGGLAELMPVPEHTVIPLPESVPLGAASLLSCAYGTCFHALKRRGTLRAGESLAVFGCGGVGLAAIQLAAAFGASEIVGVDVLDAKLRFAQNLGATQVVNAANADPVAAILEITDQRGVDLVLEATPEPRLRHSLEVARRGGRVLVVGLHPMGTQVPLHMMGFSMYNLTLVACLGYSPSRDLPPLVDLVATGRLDPSQIVSRSYPLKEVNEAYAAVEKGEVARALIQIG